MKRLLNLGNAIFFTMTVLWLFFAIRYGFEYLPVDLLKMTPQNAIVFVIITSFIFIFYIFKEKTVQFLRKLYQLIVGHKIWVIGIVTAFQLFILLTSGGLARADTTILYQIATDPNYAQETMYISNYPNNFLFLVYLKIIFRIWPENLVFNLSLLNIFFINASLLLSYRLVKEFLKERIANIYFLIYLFLFTLQPQFLYTYTDAITLFFTVVMCTVLSFLLSKWENKRLFILASLLLGLTISICYNLRPPTVIYIIALFVVLVATKRSHRFSIKKIGVATLLAFSVFYVSNATINTLLEKQDFVYYDDNYSRNLLYYVDLGLTTAGNSHSEIPEEIIEASEDQLNELVVEDITKRFESFTLTSFVGHLFNKYYWITGEGMFGWNLEVVLSEESVLQMPWIQGIINSEFARGVRSYIYARREHFNLQGMIFQFIWVLTIFGILIYSFLFRPSRFNIALWLQITLFGGFLFLMIFEGGRTRYLIQFLPPIVLLSSVGWEQLLTFVDQVKTKNQKILSNNHTQEGYKNWKS